MWLFWWAGLILQLGGVGTAFWGVASNQREYLRPGERWMLQPIVDFFALVARGFRRAWRWIVKVFTGNEHTAKLRLISKSLETRWSVEPIPPNSHFDPPAPDMSIEQRLERLEKITFVQNEHYNETQEDLAEIRHKHNALRGEIDRQGNDLRDEIQTVVGKFATTGVRLTVWGLALTSLGMLLSAFAQPPWSH